MNETCADCIHFCKGNRCLHREVVTWRKSPACLEFTGKYKGTVFDRITASPEVLAPYFVFATEDTVLSRHDERDILYFSSITGGYYQYQDNAIAATVAKLKEQSK